MTGTLRQRQQDGVAIIALTRPASHRLMAQMRLDLEQALRAAIHDPAVKAIMLQGLADLDLSDLDQDDLDQDDLDQADPDHDRAGPAPTPPQIADICQLIEGSDTPVVALWQAVTLGAGVELALAAHARIATQDAQIGFPEMRMGLCPGAGATQRLPRYLGAQGALDLLLAQHPRSVQSPPLRALVDRLLGPDDDPQAAGIALALSLADDVAAGQALRRSGDLRDGLADFAANASAIAARRAQIAAPPVSPGDAVVARITDCVEAACLLPFAAGLAFEAVTHQDLLASDLSRALRHVRAAERRALRIPALSGVTTAPVQRVAVVGGSVTAAHLAVACLAAGQPVIQFERSPEAVTALRARVAAALAACVRKGQLTADKAEAQIARWHGTTQLADLAGADLLIEAVSDHLPAKQQVMAALATLAPEGAVLATTSALHGITDIAATSGRPAAVLGLRLAAPAHLTQLAEVIPGPATAPQALARTIAFLRDGMGRIPICTGTAPATSTGGGGMGEVILTALRQAGAGMLRLGTSPAAIDSALQDYGLAHGLFRQMDMIGLETCLAQARVATAVLDMGQTCLADLDRLILAGRKGQGAGRGYYLWQDGQPQPDRAVMALLDLPDDSQPRPLSAEAIVLRALAAMANAGARALRAGIARRPSDIDVVMIRGHGFPRWHGGPMHAADQVGLFDIQQALKRLSADDPALYTPDPLFAALVREGQSFATLNQA